MPRLAPRLLALATALGLLGLARPAAASSALSIFVVPTLVELLPNEEAPDRVVLHGAFLRLVGDPNPNYVGPDCGVIYFRCAAGQEALCRMQWNELQRAISANLDYCLASATSGSCPRRPSTPRERRWAHRTRGTRATASAAPGTSAACARRR